MLSNKITEHRALCFVLMPFGKKQDVAGSVINFDSVYSNFIGPTIKQAGLEPIRADEEMTGGIIHKPMFERLIGGISPLEIIQRANDKKRNEH